MKLEYLEKGIDNFFKEALRDFTVLNFIFLALPFFTINFFFIGTSLFTIMFFISIPDMDKKNIIDGIITLMFSYSTIWLFIEDLKIFDYNLKKKLILFILLWIPVFYFIFNIIYILTSY